VASTKSRARTKTLSRGTHTPEEVELHFGALAQPLAAQIAAQCLPVNAAVVERWQRANDAVVLLHLHGHISDSTVLAIRRRLMRTIIKHYRVLAKARATGARSGQDYETASEPDEQTPVVRSAL
jgi:hypothetical protein